MTRKMCCVATAVCCLGIAMLFWGEPIGRAQDVAADETEDSWYEIHGVGAVNLDAVELEVQQTLRVPGSAPKRSRETYGDLPPIPASPAGSDLPLREVLEPGAPLTVPDGPPLTADEVRKAQQQFVELTHPANGHPPTTSIGGTQRAVPDDAYLKALNKIDALGPTNQKPTEPPEPQSLGSRVHLWLANLGSWAASEARADLATCSQAPQWQSIGPAPYNYYNSDLGSYAKQSGIVKAIAPDPSTYDPISRVSRTLYLGTRSGGLWRTQNAHQDPNWTTSTDSLAPPNRTTLQFEAIRVHPQRPTFVFAGTGSTDYDGGAGTGLPLGVGLMRSTDGGSTWNQIGPTLSQSIYDSTIAVKEIAIDTVPTDSVVWIATPKGLWYSVNAAKSAPVPPTQVTWTRITSLPNDGSGQPEGVNHIFISAANHQTLYTSIPTSTAGHSGWYKSIDGGTSWSPINTNLPLNPLIGRAAIGAGDAIYMIVIGDTAPSCGTGGWDRLYKTTNGGASWTKLNPTSMGSPVCDCCFSVAVSPTNASEIVAGTIALWRSTDGGNTATFIGNNRLHADQRTITFDPTNSQIVYVGNDGGIWKYDSASGNFQFLHGNLANLEFYHGGTDTLNYANSAGGTQDNGCMKGGMGSIWTTVPCNGDGKWALFDPQDSNTMYLTGFSNSSDLKKSADGGASVRAKNSGFATPVDVHSDNLSFDPNGTVPGPFAGNSQVLLAWQGSGSDRKAYRTTTAAEPVPGGGPAWGAISQPFNPTWGETKAIAAAPTSTNPSKLIFAGTGSGVVRTTPATFGTFSQVGGIQIPYGDPVRSFAFEEGQQCTDTN